MKIKFFLLLNLLILTSCNNIALPVAIFHGFGDACSNSGMQRITKYFSEKLNNTYTKCIETGGSENDIITSFQTQAEKGCEAIKSDERFNGDFSVVGLSQGSLLARYIIQKCDIKGKVKNYISIGGPQMGVAKFPHCSSGIICRLINGLVGKAVYYSFIQEHVGPAGYYKTHYDFDTYLKFSSFLADLNNERNEKNPEYKRRIMDLNRVLLIKFKHDTMIIPKETAHFEFYDKNDNVISLKDSDFYNQDYLGVKKLIEDNKVKFVELDGDHLRFSNPDIDNYMIPMLN
jgi:palmitoyl-protein thioesterase